MLFQPHILQVWVADEPQKNDKGNFVPGSGDWIEICPCRCDDNGTQRQIGVNGLAKLYNYHIVFEHSTFLIEQDQKIRVLNKDQTIRAEGKVLKRGRMNYLNYEELYV